MSRQLIITTPDFRKDNTGWVSEPRTLTEDFSAIPSDTFTEGWIVHQATLHVWLKSYWLLASGDVFITIDDELVKKNYTDPYDTGEINPSSGGWYTRNILPLVNSQGDFDTINFAFEHTINKSVLFQDLTITYLGLPYNFSLNTSGNGSVAFSHSENSETSVLVEATPNTGYKFSHWSDGSTANPYHFDPGSGVTDVALTANFTPIQYTVEYYDCTSGSEVLYRESQVCSYDASYNTLSFPSFKGDIPTGYNLNPTGWVQEKNANIRYGTEEMYLEDHSTLVTQYTTFSNLTDVDGAVIKMYFCLYPYSYAINYVQYSKNSTDEANITILPTEYRIFNDGDYTLTTLPKSSTGYKLANQMQEQYGPVDTSLTNNWFTSPDAMKPGDPTISFISSTYADNITLYSYEVLLNYIVNFYKFTLDGEEPLKPKVWEYGITYDLPELPTIEVIPEGYAVNPRGWVSSKTGSIRNNTSDMYSGTSTTTKLTQSTTCTKQPTTDQQVYNFYFGTYPIQYLVNYKKYVEGSYNNYTSDTDYRIYNLNNYTLKSLPEATTGYKLTNKMHNIKEQIDNNITNSWFISVDQMQPGDSTITSIAATTTQDITVYSYETPIDYEVYYHIYDYDNTKISSVSQWYKFNENITLPSQPDKLPGRVPFGWYQNEQDVSSWRVLVDSDNIIVSTEDIFASFNSNIKNLTDEDFKQIDLYAYYLPKTYSIYYEWDDPYSQDLDKYSLPNAQQIVYGKDNYDMPLIPEYQNYFIDNANTVKWYYYDHNDKTTPRLTNESITLPKFLTENMIFYAVRRAKPRYIKFISNHNFGDVIINQYTPNEDGYMENTVLEVYAYPSSENKAFISWGDEDRNPIRQILITDENETYYMYFRDESKTKGIVDLYKGSSRLESVYISDNIQFINQPYVYTEPTYTLTNLNTTYKFTYDSTTGYYTSGNSGQPNSYSLCQIDINSKVRCLMHIDCINNSEVNYDFGILSKLNQSLSSTSSKDSEDVSQMIFDTAEKHSDNIQTITYQIPKGVSFVQIKYKKDGSANNNLDCLKFKIRFEEEL